MHNLLYMMLHLLLSLVNASEQSEEIVSLSISYNKTAGENKESENSADAWPQREVLAIIGIRNKFCHCRNRRHYIIAKPRFFNFQIFLKTDRPTDQQTLSPIKTTIVV